MVGTVVHLARRGLSAAQEHFGNAAVDPQYIQKLNEDAMAYELSPAGEIHPSEMLPVLLTAVIALLALSAISYTLGDLMATLAMIESPASDAIIEPKPPAYKEYSDEPDLPLQKGPLLVEEQDLEDLQVILVTRKPVTAKIRTTMAVLHSVGGFFSRWRGAPISFAYHLVHSFVYIGLCAIFDFGAVSDVLWYVLVSVGMARFHMLWTHSMIAKPSSRRLRELVVPRKDSMALVLPSIVYSLAQQAVGVVPMFVALTLGLHTMENEDVLKMGCSARVWLAVRFLAVPASALIVALFILLPASATLTRIEAVLLPEDREAIVPFDRYSLLGELDLTTSAGRRALFMQTWKSFDWSARLRLVKLYVKMGFIYFMVCLTAVHLMIAEVYMIGGERLGPFVKAGSAQIQLMMLEQQGVQT